MTTETTSKVERVVVGIDGSPGSMAALRHAAVEAQCHGAELWPVIAWVPPGGEAMNARYPAPEDARMHWAQDAQKQLTDVCTEVLGSDPQEMKVVPKVVRGRAEDVLVAYADRSTDVLVVGASGHGHWHHFLFGSVSHQCLKRAHCPVLLVHPEGEGAHDVRGSAPSHDRGRRVPRGSGAAAPV